METKVCSVCKVEKDVGEFYSRKDRACGVRPRCKACCSIDMKNKKDKHREKKIDFINYKGGLCSMCGEMPHPAAMDFHHIDPKQKEYTIGQMGSMKWEKAKKELDKCILLCSNCHRELHYNG